jgi:ElaB/YqjD/DUF883 family membrane-anchored ribosome-binding protein
MENNNSTTETRDALVKDVAQLKQDAAQIAQDVKAHANAHVDQTKKRFNDALSNAKATIAARPLAILATGIVLGYIFGARRRRRRS